MAAVRSLRTSGIFLLLFLLTQTHATSAPWIFAVDVNARACSELKCVYNLNVNGLGFDVWSITYVPAARGEGCEGRFSDQKPTKGVELVVAVGEKLFFCARGADGEWYHQGAGLFLEGSDVIGPIAQPQR